MEHPFSRGDKSPALRAIRPLKRARRVSPPDRRKTRDVYRRVEHVPPTASGSQSNAEIATCSPLRKGSFTAGFWAAVQGAPFMGQDESSRAIDRPAGAPFQVYAPNRTPTAHLTSRTEVRATAVNVARVSTREGNPTSKARAGLSEPKLATPGERKQLPKNRNSVFLDPQHLPPSPHLLETSQETASRTFPQQLKAARPHRDRHPTSKTKVRATEGRTELHAANQPSPVAPTRRARPGCCAYSENGHAIPPVLFLPNWP